MAIPCTYQPLKEGYRSWASGFCVSKAATGPKLDLAYEFVNWFLSGWAGAYLNRQGYYSAVLPTAKANMTPDEWAFWMEGKAAINDIKAPDGTVLEKAGAKRDGGSYDERMGSVVCWNAIMDENDYMVRKGNELIAAGGGGGSCRLPPAASISETMPVRNRLYDDARPQIIRCVAA